MTTRVPFAERGGAIRGCLDLVSGRFPRFVFGGRLDQRRLLPVFHFHEVTREDLEPKLRYLAENGYRTAASDDIAAYVRGERHFDAPHVALCFDDAWSSLWTVAAPLLKHYGLTAITYAIPARILDAPAPRPALDPAAPAGSPTAAAMDDPPFVTWPELRALHTSGVIDVQSHTDSHSMIFCAGELIGFVTPEYTSTPMLNRPQLSPLPALRFVRAEELGAPLYPSRSRMSDGRRVAVSIDAHERCVARVRAEGGQTFFSRPDWRGELTRLVNGVAADVESDSAQERAIDDELDRGRAVLNERLRTNTVSHICLPWGVSGQRTAAALVRLGYRSAFANRLRGVHAVRPGDDPYWLKRLPNKYITHLPGRGRRIWL